MDDELQTDGGIIDPNTLEDALPEVEADDSEDGLGDPLGLKDEDDEEEMNPVWDKEEEEKF